MGKSKIILSVIFFGFCAHATELREREELFSRRPIGTHRICATTDVVVSGKGKVDLMICQPYPESNKYQDVKWLKEVPINLRATYAETGHPYVRFAERVNAPTTINIERDYVVTLYDVRFNWSAITTLYQYDKTSEEYVRYTRRYPCDITDTNAYEKAYLWITETSKKIKNDSMNDLDYVRRVYSAVTTEFTYGDWSGGFTNLIARKQGDCGGITHVFVCLLREGGIPARAMVCLRPDEGPHVWPEFYLQDYGWIPTDPTFDLGKTSNPENFGVRCDNTIVMTYDTGFTVQTAGGVVIHNVFVQGLAWWWYWKWEGLNETQRNVVINTAWKNFPGTLTDVKLGDWYEAHDIEELCMLNRWDDFAMGAKVAIPVIGLNSPISALDVVVTAGTYSEFDTPTVLSESEMWARYGAPVLEQKNLGNVEFDGYDNVWQNWDAEEDGAYGYELSADIWPDWQQVSGRQWILIPTGVPRLGTHTFSLKIKGIEHDEYVVRFEKARDQEPVIDDVAVCEIQFDANGGSMNSAVTRSVKKDAVIGTLPVPTRTKFKFIGWYTAKAGGTKVTADTKVSANVTYYARWEILSFKLVLHKNDGTGTSKEISVKYGSPAELPGAAKILNWAPRRGFSFMGWATSEKSKNVFLKDQAKVTTALSSKDTLHVYAIWQLKPSTSYAIQYIRNDGSGSVRTIGFNGGVATKLNSVKALGFERRGYTFVGWATSTENARAKKVWKKDMGVVSQPVANGKLLQVYAIWKLTPGYYSIRFNKNDGSGKWRELGYKYGENTTLPTIANGLQWSRAGYTFGGWATSAANAAKGIVWRGDKGVTRTPIAAGKTLNVYAIWKKTGATVAAVNRTSEQSTADQTSHSSVENALMKLLPGYYSGELADGTGMYDLFVDEGGETGYVNIVFDDGSTVSGEVDVDFLGDIILVTSEDGEMTPLRYNQ